jgi:hypothetical protein
MTITAILFALAALFFWARAHWFKLATQRSYTNGLEDGAHGERTTIANWLASEHVGERGLAQHVHNRLHHLWAAIPKHAL